MILLVVVALIACDVMQIMRMLTFHNESNHKISKDILKRTDVRFVIT